MGSGNYGGSKHFSWMISFGTAEEQAKVGGRRISCGRGGEGSDERERFSWDERRRQVEGRKTAEEIRELVKCLWEEIMRKSKCERQFRWRRKSRVSVVDKR